MKNLIVIIARYCFKNSQSRPVRQDMDAAAPLYPKILLKIKDIAPSGGSLFTSEFPHRRAIGRIPKKGTVRKVIYRVHFWTLEIFGDFLWSYMIPYVLRCFKCIKLEESAENHGRFPWFSFGDESYRCQILFLKTILML